MGQIGSPISATGIYAQYAAQSSSRPDQTINLDQYNTRVKATVAFYNANQITKNNLHTQYLVSKDLDPILLRKHLPPCQRDHEFNNIITKQDS
jgi:hypothetical protein